MDWLTEAWRFIESKENQETLTFIGVGIAVAGAAAWQVYTHFARSGSSEQAFPTVTASGGGLAPIGDLHIAQPGPGTLIVGGVHGVPPEDFQRVSANLGITEAALASFFKVLEKQKAPPRTSTAPCARSPSASSSSRRTSGAAPPTIPRWRPSENRRVQPWRPASSIGPSNY